MILAAIKNLLRERTSISLRDLSLHFQIEESALEKMMELLVRHGDVSRLETNCSAGPCFGCPVGGGCLSRTIFYQTRELEGGGAME